MAVKILVTENIDQAGLKRLEAEPGVSVTLETKWSAAELVASIGEYHALIVRSHTMVDANLLAAATKLKVVGRAGVGVDNIDVTAATHQGILVVNAPEANTTSTAEHTLAMMMALARNIPDACISLRQGQWERSKYMGVQLAGKKLGVLGLGRVGSEVARRAQALDMKVIAYDPFISPERARQLGVSLASVSEVCNAVDFLTVHTPLTAQTRGLVGAGELAGVRPGLRIINCARGGIVDETALLAALNDGRVAGAALDVFNEEPPQGNPLVNHPNVIVTPHLGASTHEAQTEAAIDVVDAVLHALAGQPVRSAVNSPYLRGLQQDNKGYLELTQRVGCVFADLFTGGYSHIELIYDGDITAVDAEALTASALRGILAGQAPEVNYINARMLAEERGIIISEMRRPQASGYTNMVTIRSYGSNGEHSISAHLTEKGLRRLVAIDGYHLNVEAQGEMIIARNLDQPGIIGQVGTALGKHGINISFMQVGRKIPGKLAVMAVGIDQALSAAAWEELINLKALQEVRLVQW